MKVLARQTEKFCKQILFSEGIVVLTSVAENIVASSVLSDYKKLICSRCLHYKIFFFYTLTGIHLL
jgi:hypothetical protein